LKDGRDPSLHGVGGGRVMTADFVVVLITVGSADEASAIAQQLVEGRLAACVNAVPGVRCLFQWQGAIDSACETLLVAKTRSSLLPRLVESVRRVHSYSVPEIIALPIIGGNADYLKWLADETAAAINQE
jgi:periplasmic divalent cation tolerance protein